MHGPTDIIPQGDGATRYLYECPRGTIAIDQDDDGEVELTRCLGGSALTRRDEREALALHRDRVDDDDYDDDYEDR
jgi:hypothetical protein